MTDGMLLVVLEADADCTHVLQRAALLARRRQLQVTLLVAERNAALERSYLFDLDAQHRAREGFLRGRRKWLEKQANTLRDMDLEVDLEVVWTRHRDTAILEHAHACGARLIMKATHKHSLLTRAILSQEDWRLIRDTPVPLWLVRDMPWDAHVALGVCVDPLHDGGETRDIQLLAEAHALAVDLPAELHVIHACEVVPTGLLAEFDVVLAEDAELHDRVRTRHREALDALLENRVEPGTPIHLEDGAPDTVIPAVVNREGLDLVIMGAVARSGLDRLFVGSTAERVMDLVDADLLILK